MRLPLLIFLSLFSCLLASAEPATGSSLNPRLIELAANPSLTEEDHQFLIARSKGLDSDGCVSTALLFKHWPDQHRDEFKKLYAINPAVKITILPDAEINARVNARLKELQGRHPLEVTSQLYLMVRGSGYASKRPNGDERGLEMVFRAAVFTGVVADRSIDEVHRFSATADGKKPPAKTVSPNAP